MTEYKHECTPENAEKFWKWIKERQGVAVWKSIDLSDPGFSVSSPVLDPEGKPYTKPHWKLDSTPAFVVTDPAEIAVIIYKEVKRFHVAVRMGSQGLSLKLTDGSTRRLHKALDKAGEGAVYNFDYETQEAVISVPNGTISLKEWAAIRGE